MPFGAPVAGGGLCRGWRARAQGPGSRGPGVQGPRAQGGPLPVGADAEGLVDGERGEAEEAR